MKSKLIVSIVAVLGLAVAGLFAAEEKGKGASKGGKGKGGSPEARAEMMIKRGDKDGDGKLDKKELTALFEAQAKGGSRGGKGGGEKGGGEKGGEGKGKGKGKGKG